ncbi:MAG: SMC-Scp complex subunit ScpB [Pirellulales bacterium]|nr:SMC-Scp complex subunit ScpB [Pirellulales bacterium]
MRASKPSTAQRLGSVATRYRHPIASGGCLHWRNSGVRIGLPACLPLRDGGIASIANQLSRLEAILFLSRGPQTSRKLAQSAGLADGTKARTLIRNLNRRYEAEGRAFVVEEVAGGFQLLTRPKFAPWLRRLHREAVETRLSAALLETLAVVAYRQPVLRAEIEAIRGVQSGEVLRQLVERDLVRIAGRSEELGRPYLYGTTKQFLQIFGLRHLDELPRAEILRNRESAPVDTLEVQTLTHSNTSNQSKQPQAAEEEENVKTLIARKSQHALADGADASLVEHQYDERTNHQTVLAQLEDEDDDQEDEFLDDDEDDDLDDDEFDDFDDEDDDEDDEDDEDLDDEPWEEVEDDDEDWEEDDDEEDWDDDDWEDDEEEEDEEKKVD